MNSASPSGLYVHVPFCKGKCRYCDFFSVTGNELVEPWLHAVCREASLFADEWGEMDSLYLGGGTPSVLSHEQLAYLLDRLRLQFRFSADTETTIEMNPDDVDTPRMRRLRRMGFNRVSLGVQSFREAELAWLGRRHDVGRARSAIEAVKAAGFDNLALDLIYGLPGQTRGAWEQNLRLALQFQPEHLSCYLLTVEEGTPLGRMHALGRFQPLGEEEVSDLFLFTSRFLEEEGYLHYEVSNFARGAQRISRHNGKYWSHIPCLGLGPSAHSYRAKVRWWNVRSVGEYCRKIASGERPTAGSEELDREQLKLEAVYLGLRTGGGIPLALLENQPHSLGALDRLVREGFLRKDGDRILPTRRGYLVSDRLPLELLP